jgi:NAD(P)-dependent dehydrogenase (short-subunit alcohol dehydrogenase family)
MNSATAVNEKVSLKTLSELMNLRGRVGIVTGGAGHLGQAYCDALAELGADVCVLDVRADVAAQKAQELAIRYGTHCSAIAADITHEDEVARAINEIVAVHGRLDILVNNAAYPQNDLPPDGSALTQQSLAQWKATLDVVLTGAFLMTRACVPHLVNGGQGVVVNVASVYGMVGPDMRLYEGTDMRNPANYAAAKGGIVQLTRYLATTLAPKIRVNCIAPGGIWRGQLECFHQRYCSRTPLGRMGTEEDLKGVLAFLASDLSAYVTGQVVLVDGGWTAW